MKNEVSRQKLDELCRKYNQKLPKGYALIDLAYSKGQNHSYALAQHFRKEEYIFMQSDKKGIHRFTDFDLMNLIKMVMDVKGVLFEESHSIDSDSVEVQ